MVEEVGTRRSHDILQNLASLLSSREAKNNENSQLFQLLCPDKFDIVVQGVMDMSNTDIKMGQSQVGTPSLALRIGYSFKKCIEIGCGKPLHEKDGDLVVDIEHSRNSWKLSEITIKAIIP